MQLSVDGDYHQAGVPAGIQDLEILRTVLHRQGHPVARLETQPNGETPGQPRHSLRKSLIAEEHGIGPGHCGPFTVGKTRPYHVIGDVHLLCPEDCESRQTFDRASPQQSVAKVVQERKMGTATNPLPVMAPETKHLA